MNHLLPIVNTLLVAVLAGCEVTGPSRESVMARDEARLRWQLGPEIKHVPVRQADLRRLCPRGHPGVTVRLMKPADAPEAPWPSNLTEGALNATGMASMGVFIVALGPLYAGAGVAAVFIAPLYAVLGAINEAQARAIIRALEEEDLPHRLEGAIARRLEERMGGPRLDDVEVIVHIIEYGFAGDEHTRLVCFSFDADVEVRQGSRALFCDRVLMGPYLRSTDTPPPHRDDLADIARHDGAAARRTLDDSAEIIAAVIVRRLGVESR